MPRKKRTKKEKNFESVTITKVDPNSIEWKEKIQSLEKKCLENLHPRDLKYSRVLVKK